MVNLSIIATDRADVADVQDSVRRVVEELDESKAARWRVGAARETDGAAVFDEVVVANPTGGVLEITLPAIATTDIGRAIVVYNGSSSATTVTIRAVSATIDGAATTTLAAAWASVWLVAIAPGLWATV